MDWLEFLRSSGIDHVAEGKNVAKGNLNVKCPFCGPSDMSYHMGIHLETGKWGCWRDPRHRGKNPVYLVAILLGVDYRAAEKMVDAGRPSVPTIEELRKKIENIGRAPKSRKTYKRILMPPSFFPIRKTKGITSVFYNYLKARGFEDPQHLAEFYDLRGSLSGTFRYRVICPIMCEGLLGWTGRSISSKAQIKYLSFPDDRLGGAVFNHDKAKHGETLVICEGPFDALKIDDSCWDEGVRAVALMGLSFNGIKIQRLLRLSERFSRVKVLLDSDAMAASVSLVDHLNTSDISVKSAFLPRGVKDPGEMSRDALRHLLC